MTLHKKKRVKLGLERVLESPGKFLANSRVGLICNQASVSHRFLHAADLFSAHAQIDLRALFGPQHGIRGDVQDNMVETVHTTDAATGLPVFSLYSETREPTEEMLENIDVLVFDLQDVGCRVYTFIYTMANAMRACARYGKRFLVCDRPNPVNGLAVEGGLLERGHESFVGQYPIPMRHGMTAGELALLFNEEFGIGCELGVAEMDGWSREYFYDETDCPWVPPSPNMPTVDTAAVFPGSVFFEGTMISEGRGTTRPFELIGAPWIDAGDLAERLGDIGLEGVVCRPTAFLPTFQKHAGATCEGVFLHVTDRERFRPVITGVAVLKEIRERYPGRFEWKKPPYEYVSDRNPFDVIAGTNALREALGDGIGIAEIAGMWSEDEEAFRRTREPFLLYS